MKRIDLHSMDDGSDWDCEVGREDGDTIAWDVDALDEIAVHHVHGDPEQWCEITVDSGAAVSVAPKTMFTGSPMTTPPNRKTYRAANGGRIEDLGGRKVRFATDRGEERSMNFRVADVTKPLASVSRICARGNRVVFDGPDSYIEHKSTGARTSIRESKGVYVIDVVPIDNNDAKFDDNNGCPGFGGQGA